jgi:hypothetical protein
MVFYNSLDLPDLGAATAALLSGAGAISNPESIMLRMILPSCPRRDYTSWSPMYNGMPGIILNRPKAAQVLTPPWDSTHGSAVDES